MKSARCAPLCLNGIEAQYRYGTREAGTYKKRIGSKDHSDRDFGGLNVIYAGDFWQLDPPGPEGVPLTSVPTYLRAEGSGRRIPAPADHGLEIPSKCQGVT